ncbi:MULTISPECIES: lytic polysaccharide monooxygenase [Cellulosimicrobium]|uniref:lytic polysaccharide monooxygenase n=2 Tax=Cellulosimicrobium TaxID=157920 RepID=UPI002097A1A3|nr:lytic polysaccharide monooxygenase [Cellulosimicrobium cellulans]MCO7274728.1 lytic polysaccharide monooxygenase [Cellulosimicrobium cellulans]
MRRLRATLVAAVVGAAAIVAPVVVAPSASAHGWITSPASRQEQCASSGTLSFDCGEIKYEPQSVEAVKGSMQCSGGSRFAILDDSSKPWKRTTVGSTVTFQWELEVAHATSTWEYFVDGVLFKTFNDGGKRPAYDVSHTLTGLPSGNHTILARWNIADTNNAFYNCVDVNVNGTGGNDPDPEPTDPEPTDPGPGECTAPAWAAGSVYLGGATVSHDGRTYQAKWWTTGENPAQSGQWGVWKDLGAC